MKFPLALVLALTALPCLADPAPGLAPLSDATNADRPLALSLWYPSAEEPSGSIGGNAVFQGVPAATGAVLPESQLSLVVVSHGGLRSAANSGAWLSAALAQAGFVVAEVNAPRPESAAAALDEIWQRPQDIRRAIDIVLGNDTWRGRIDADRIAVIGFALGGTAALSLAGAGMDAQGYMDSCSGGQAPDCGWLAAQGVSLTDTSPAGLARLSPDPRVTAAVALGPEYMASLDLAPMTAPALLIALGPEALAASAAAARSVTLPEASIYDGFAACTEAGPAILEEDGAGAICGTSAASREAVHQRLTEVIASFLTERVE